MWWLRKKSYPNFYKAYLNLQDAPSTQDLISIDFETDGLDAKTAHVLSYGSVDIRGQKIIANTQVEWFFQSKNEDEENIKVHEIFSEGGIGRFDEKIPEILQRISNKTILGHYVTFDIQLINAGLKRLGAGKLQNATADTLLMALKYDGVRDYSTVKKEDYSLYALCRRFGIEVKQTHAALTDAYLTALLYLHLK